MVAVNNISGEHLSCQKVFGMLHHCCQTSCPLPAGHRGLSAATAGPIWTVLRKAGGDQAALGLSGAAAPDPSGPASGSGSSASVPVPSAGQAASGKYCEPALGEDVHTQGTGPHAAGLSQQVSGIREGVCALILFLLRKQ